MSSALEAVNRYLRAGRRRGRRLLGRKPVLGLAGFFGAGNYGDELFLEVFKQHFGDEFELRILADLTKKPYYSQDLDAIIDEVDAILIGGGDLIQGWQIDPRYFHPSFLRRPVFIVGVGVPLYANGQPEKPAVMRKLRKFFSHPNLKFIGVRDEQAQNWITEKLAPVEPVRVAPDIVTTWDLPKAEKPEGAPILGIATRFRPRLETPDDYTQVAALAAHAQAAGWRVRHVILGTGEVGVRDLSNASDLDVPGKEVVHSEDLDQISRWIGECSAFASMKFHGTVVATMYGVPSIVMIPTNKNRNFMTRLGLAGLIARFDHPELIDIFENRPTPDPAVLAATRAETEAHLAELARSIHTHTWG